MSHTRRALGKLPPDAALLLPQGELEKGGEQIAVVLMTINLAAAGDSVAPTDSRAPRNSHWKCPASPL